jgi:hypothetical protein
MNAETAGHAGTPQLKQFLTVNIKMTLVFRHPKYYKELRKRNKSDQVISLKAHDGECERAPGPGQQAPSPKQQASSVKPQASEASSDKLQGPSSKRQA